MSIPKAKNMAANQLIIWCGEITVFQSYNTTVAMMKSGKTYLNKHCWNMYSQTTNRYLNQFLGTSSVTEIREGVESGEYIVVDNFDEVSDISIDQEATKLAKVDAIDKWKWANNALHVARFGNGASSGERASYYGLPLLYDALMKLSALDPYHRAAVGNFVTDWANGSTKELWETLQQMYHAHDSEEIKQKKVNQ